jgi:hypothetical protein
MHDRAEDHHDHGRKEKETTGDDPEDAEWAQVALESGGNGSEGVCG